MCGYALQVLPMEGGLRVKSTSTLPRVADARQLGDQAVGLKINLVRWKPSGRV
jgi:hypothetical protein